MNNDLSYYEIEMGYLKDGADEIEYESPFSLCVLTKYFPDDESVIALCKDELGKDFDYVHSITHIVADEQKEQYADRTYRLMTPDERREIKHHIRSLMNLAIVSEDLEKILNCVDTETGESFADAVINDVKACYVWKNEGYVSNDDIRSAIGRELMARLGVQL